MSRKDKKVRAGKASRASGWRRGAEEGRRRGLRRAVGWALAAVAGVGAVAACMKALERHVLTAGAGGLDPQVRIVLADPPEWVPESRVREIAASLLAPRAHFKDPDLTAAVYRRAQQQPWIRRVLRVTKRLADDEQTAEVRVQAEIRQPIALVQTANVERRYVDADGVNLPDPEVPKWVAIQPAADGKSVRRAYYADYEEIPPGVRAAKIHYIVIQGVAEPPPKPGRPWQGQDIADALRVVRLVLTRKYANQITVVDVRNHAARLSRHEPEIRMYAQLPGGPSTDIRFGRFPMASGGDYVVAPDRKISYLDEYVADHNGRLAGLNHYIDLRHDELRFSVQ